MDKIWFIKIDSHEEGPFSLLDLRRHPSVTPDTLVWKEGFKEWIPIRKVKELKSVFEDAEEASPPKENNKPKLGPILNQDEQLALDMRRLPPSLLIWILLLLVALLSYLVYWLNER